MSQHHAPGPLDPHEPLTEDEMCTMPLSVHADPADWPAPVRALGRVPGPQPPTTAPPLAELTTLRVGGPVGRYVEAASEAELIDAVRRADAEGGPLLVIGGGSNILAADAGFDGVVVRDARTEVELVSDSGMWTVRPAARSQARTEARSSATSVP